MILNKNIFISFILFFVSGPMALAGPQLCRDLFYQGAQSHQENDKKNAVDKIDERKFPKFSVKITADELSSEAAHKMLAVPEFQFIRKEAEHLGLRVWLFGGTASSYLHYVKWNLRREKGINQMQADRFDFDYTNIFRSTQDLDIVVDGSAEQAREFQRIIAAKYPHFLGAKAAKWEMRTLRTRMGIPGEIGYKEALLGDEDFNHQNSDSNSLGMVEVTHSKEPVVRDLRHWESVESPFLQDALNDRISFFRSGKHFTTSRAKAGENPEILSVVRLLVKAFQYELKFSENEFNEMKAIVDQFDPKQLQNAAAKRRLEDTAKKLVMHATNIEYAMDQLDRLGLRKKLIEMGEKDNLQSGSWWLNKEPLRSKPVGEGTGKTAEELRLKVVAHETNTLLAYESITRAHSGEPNVLISRSNIEGEFAFYGDGFYTRLGREGAKGSGLTIRFTVDPKAREGTDFKIVKIIVNEEVTDEYIVFNNKKALKVIPESLNFTLDDLLKIAENKLDIQIDKSDLGLLEMFKRRINFAKITDELEKLLFSELKADQDRLVSLLYSLQNPKVQELISPEVFRPVAQRLFNLVFVKARSSHEADVIRYIKTVGPILKTIDSMGLLKPEQFYDYLTQIVQTPTASFELKKKAVFELLQTNKNFEEFLRSKRGTAADDIKAVIEKVMPEIFAWDKSPELRKRQFALWLDDNWSSAVLWRKANVSGDPLTVELLVDSKVYDVNHKNRSQISILQFAEYFNSKEVIEWLISNPKFDFNRKNNLGFTEVEQLRLRGKTELADHIQQLRPEVVSRRFVLKERNTEHLTAEYPKGSPIIDFVRIEPTSYMMGDGKNGELTTVAKPFEVLSVDTNQHMYRLVAELIKKHLGQEYIELNSTPSKFLNEENPVEQVSAEDVNLWKKGLNELSELNDIQVQQSLGSLFPGHKKGAKYDLPTEAQWELVSRLGGVAIGNASFDPWIGLNLRDYAVDGWNGGLNTQPVGSLRPVFYNGKPLYDLQGNVWKLTKDSQGKKSARAIPQNSKTDSPQILRSGVIVRGGSFRSRTDASEFSASHRGLAESSVRYDHMGFRLVRSIE